MDAFFFALDLQAQLAGLNITIDLCFPGLQEELP